MLLGSGWFSYSPPICWLRLERADENWKRMYCTTFEIGYSTIDCANGPSVWGRFRELHSSNELGRCCGSQLIRACDQCRGIASGLISWLQRRNTSISNAFNWRLVLRPQGETMRWSVEWTIVPFVTWEQGISIPAVGTARGFQTFIERFGRFGKISRKHVVGFLIECQG
jgi:hypothetical protein